MIYGNIHTSIPVQPVPPVISRALAYLSSNNLEALDFGVYEPDPQFSVQVIDVTTKNPSETRAEVHREKLDIQYSISGEETIYCRVAPTSQPITNDQFAQRDIGFYDVMDEEVAFPLNKGDFVVFFPGEIHRPGCQKGAPARIKRLL